MARRSSRAVGRPPEFYRALAATGQPGDWSTRGTSLRARCAHVRDTLHALGVDDATLDAWWPGGEENSDHRGAAGWLRCMFRYQFLHGQHAGRRTNTSTGDVELQRAITDGLTGAPAYVLCSDGVERAVYPKAYPVHEALTALDAAIAQLHAVAQESADLLDVASADQMPNVVLRSIYVRQWLWIVTTPGDEAPFDIQQPMRRWPMPPQDEPHAWLRHLKGADVVACVVAFNKVDRHDIGLMSMAFPKQGSGAASRLSFAGFLGTRADAKGIDIRKTSVKRIIAGAVSEAVTHDEARARAEQESRARKPV